MTEVIYKTIAADSEPTVIDSLCVNCEEQGKTTLLLTKIPFFQDVIVMSFYCDKCGYRNNEIQTGGILKPKGIKIKIRLTYPKDLNRDIVRSEFATIKIPEIDLEIPPALKKGQLNTIEGILQNIIDDLNQEQDIRKETQPEVYDKIEEFIKKIEKMKNGQGFPFHFIIDDPSGNSFIKNPFAPNSDPEMKVERYFRTKEQCEAMGYDWQNTLEEIKQLEAEETKEGEEKTAHKRLDLTNPISEDLKQEAIVFETPCHGCGQMGENKMCTITIPYFKELVIMAFSCDHCGAKSRDVKTGGEISAKAKCITLTVKSTEDLKRDVFKSETAILKLPEFEIEMLMSTLGGIYSTVEGLLYKVKEHLSDDNPFVGDSDIYFKKQMLKILKKLQDGIDFKREFTLVLDDPLANSFIQNPNYPNHDPNVKVEIYDRTQEQNDDLGLSDIKTENY